jgi:putative ABC transport system ATP-binding protein
MRPGSVDWLVRDVCFEVYPGDRLAIVGPSGAGKTVLLRAIAMLDPVERGVIRFRSHVIPEEAISSFGSQVRRVTTRRIVMQTGRLEPEG